jgi:hypothetical protein
LPKFGRPSRVTRRNTAERDESGYVPRPAPSPKRPVLRLVPKEAEIIRLRSAGKLLETLAPSASRFASTIESPKQEAQRPKLEHVGSTSRDIESVRQEEIRRGKPRNVL